MVTISECRGMMGEAAWEPQFAAVWDGCDVVWGEGIAACFLFGR